MNPTEVHTNKTMPTKAEAESLTLRLQEFDRCIQALTAEIKGIQEGNYDHCLNVIGSYYVLPEFKHLLADIDLSPLPNLELIEQQTLHSLGTQQIVGQSPKHSAAISDTGKASSTGYRSQSPASGSVSSRSTHPTAQYNAQHFPHHLAQQYLQQTPSHTHPQLQSQFYQPYQQQVNALQQSFAPVHLQQSSQPTSYTQHQQIPTPSLVQGQGYANMTPQQQQLYQQLHSHRLQQQAQQQLQTQPGSQGLQTHQTSKQQHSALPRQTGGPTIIQHQTSQQLMPQRSQTPTNAAHLHRVNDPTASQTSSRLPVSGINENVIGIQQEQPSSGPTQPKAVQLEVGDVTDQHSGALTIKTASAAAAAKTSTGPSAVGLHTNPVPSLPPQSDWSVQQQQQQQQRMDEARLANLRALSTAQSSSTSVTPSGISPSAVGAGQAVHNASKTSPDSSGQRGAYRTPSSPPLSSIRKNSIDDSSGLSLSTPTGSKKRGRPPKRSRDEDDDVEVVESDSKDVVEVTPSTLVLDSSSRTAQASTGQASNAPSTPLYSSVAANTRRAKFRTSNT